MKVTTAQAEKEVWCTKCLWFSKEGDYCALNYEGPSADCFVPATEEEEKEDGKEAE